MALTPVPVARKALLDSILGPTEAETLPLAQCAWRVLAGDLKALRTQPPFANSAMDGYAVRGDDMAEGASLRRAFCYGWCRNWPPAVRDMTLAETGRRRPLCDSALVPCADEGNSPWKFLPSSILRKRPAGW